jgi:nicotinate-nucleotide adenylyltransferase
MRRIGILGGTFDPIHYGHLAAAEEARAKLPLEKVIFVVAGVPPHKLNEDITPSEDRLAMVRLAIASNPYFAVSRVEIGGCGAPRLPSEPSQTGSRRPWDIGASDSHRHA